MNSLTEREIIKGKSQCDACAAPFGDGQLTHTLLDLENEPWARKDYCQTCWQRDIVPGLPSIKDYAAWSGRFKVVVPVPKQETLPKDRAQTLFRKLLEAQDPDKKNTIFVLAVMLERKKILKQQMVIRKEAAGGSPARILVYTHAQTAETIFVEDPQIRLARWDVIQQEVRDLLDLEFASSPTGAAIS